MSTADINNRNLVEDKIHESDVSVYAYDRALVEDLRARFKKPPVKGQEINDTVQFSPTDAVFRIMGQMNKDENVMPFISLQRLGWQLNLDRQMFQTFMGDKIVIDNPDIPRR